RAQWPNCSARRAGRCPLCESSSLLRCRGGLFPGDPFQETLQLVNWPRGSAQQEKAPTPESGKSEDDHTCLGYETEPCQERFTEADGGSGGRWFREMGSRQLGGAPRRLGGKEPLFAKQRGRSEAAGGSQVEQLFQGYGTSLLGVVDVIPLLAHGSLLKW